MNKITTILCAFGITLVFGCTSLKEVRKNSVKTGDDFTTIDKTTNKPFTGAVISYYPNGKIESREEYNNGLRNGSIIHWYENGQKRQHYEYFNGKRGIFKNWYPTGILSLNANMNNDKGKGYQTGYYPTGQKSYHLAWDRDIMKQTLTSWLKDGAQIANVTYCEYGRNKNGTIYNEEYRTPFIEHYYKGSLIATTDTQGNKIDVSKLEKKTDEELISEGQLITFEAEFK
jgi:antitoxin component YwqK of YwqJK toxin-antitoxin module